MPRIDDKLQLVIITPNLKKCVSSYVPSVFCWMAAFIAVATYDGAEASQEALPESVFEPLSLS
jgi:hypothetical protein